MIDLLADAFHYRRAHRLVAEQLSKTAMMQVNVEREEAENFPCEDPCEYDGCDRHGDFEYS